MKLRRDDNIWEAIPGTLIEISDNIVKKDISFIRLHKYWINIDKNRFNKIDAGSIVVLMILLTFDTR